MRGVQSEDAAAWPASETSLLVRVGNFQRVMVRLGREETRTGGETRIGDRSMPAETLARLEFRRHVQICPASVLGRDMSATRGDAMRRMWGRVPWRTSSEQHMGCSDGLPDPHDGS